MCFYLHIDVWYHVSILWANSSTYYLSLKTCFFWRGGHKLKYVQLEGKNIRTTLRVQSKHLVDIVHSSMYNSTCNTQWCYEKLVDLYDLFVNKLVQRPGIFMPDTCLFPACTLRSSKYLVDHLHSENYKTWRKQLKIHASIACKAKEEMNISQVL